MVILYKKYISRFFISIWLITQVLQLYHEYSHHILSHGNKHHVLCSHHHHKELKFQDTTTDRVSANEACVICDYEWFNLIECLSDCKIYRYILEVIPTTLGAITDAINEHWSISPFPQRGPPLRV